MRFKDSAGYKRAGIGCGDLSTEISEEELSAGARVFDEGKDREAFWENARGMSVKEYMEKKGYAGELGGGHVVHKVVHRRFNTVQFVVLENPVEIDGQRVFTQFWCSCGDDVKWGVPCRHFLVVYGEVDHCGFHCGMFHQMWRQLQSTSDSATSFKVLRVSATYDLPIRCNLDIAKAYTWCIFADHLFIHREFRGLLQGVGGGGYHTKTPPAQDPISAPGEFCPPP